MRDKWERLDPTAKAASMFFAALALMLAVPYLWREMPDLVGHLLIVVTAMMGVHLLERAYLWKSLLHQISSSMSEVQRSGDSLKQNAAKCGLAKIYPAREYAVADVLSDLERAHGEEDRVYMLGVSFTEDLTLAQVVDSLEAKQEKGLDTKILLLDGLRSTAVFRSFLESPPEMVREVVHKNRTTPLPEEPYFDHRVYSDFVASVGLLRAHPVFVDSVRFYAHTPICWMVLLRDTVYYQPYTFGEGLRANAKSGTIGSLMPVFKFCKADDTETFDILENHFQKLWLTSNTDLFQARARIADRERIIKDVFEKRTCWFKHVCGVLYEDNPRQKGVIRDKRTAPRQRCETQNKLDVEMSWEDGTNKKTVAATIEDFSRMGLGLKLTSSGGKESVVMLKKDTRVDVSVQTGSKTKFAVFVTEYLIDCATRGFLFKRGPDRTGIIGLKAQSLP